MRLARSAWIGLFAVAAIVLLASLPGFAVYLTQGLHGDEFVFDRSLPWMAVNSAAVGIMIGAAFGSVALGWIIFRRSTDDPMALFVATILVLHGVSSAGPIEAFEPWIPGIADFNVFVLQPVLFIPLSMLLYATFPDGRFIPLWTKRVVLLATVLTVPTVALSPFFFGQIAQRSPLAVLGLAYLVLFVLSVTLIYAQVHRFRHVSSPAQRQQTKWVVYGIAVWFGLIAVSSGPWLYLQGLPPLSSVPGWVRGSTLLWALSTAVLPVTLAISILRYRLYDIDLIINRTLVYAGLTAAVVTLYAAAVVGFGALFQSNLTVALLATSMAAIVFQPLRGRLQRWVNRLMYGERDEPYRVLTRLGRQLEQSLTPEATLPAVVEIIGQTLKLPYVAIALGTEDDRRIAASHGLPTPDTLDLPLAHQGEAIGVLQVAGRAPGETFSPQEVRLLEALARQVGVAAQAARLTQDLQRARQQLVTSREEERRRLRRDLHDGLGPTLASLNLQAGAVRQLLQQDPERADALVSQLKTDIHTTIDEVRRLVYDLRPPALDELGLVGAIRLVIDQAQRARTDGAGPTFRIEAPAALPPLPAAVEVAAYRIVQEAVANVVRHARARHCTVALRPDGELQVEVRDDGLGPPPDWTSGVGWISMRERTEELGGTLSIERNPEGGTRVFAALPAQI